MCMCVYLYTYIYIYIYISGSYDFTPAQKSKENTSIKERIVIAKMKEKKDRLIIFSYFALISKYVIDNVINYAYTSIDV